MSWFYLTVFSVIALASGELLQQKLLNKQTAFTERASAVLTFLFQAILSFLVLIVTPYYKDLASVFTPQIFPQLMAVTSLASVAMIFYLRSFKVKNISYSTIFGSSSIVVSTILGIIIFNEGTHPQKFLGILLILVAIVLLNYKNVQLEKNHFFSLLSGIIFGICVVFDKSIVQTVPTPVYMFWTFFFSSLFGFLFSPSNVLRSMKGKRIRAYRLIVVSGVCYFLYNFLTFTAYQIGGEVGKVDAINNTTVFLIILFEFFILRHTVSIKRKIITAIIAYLGVALLGFF